MGESPGCVCMEEAGRAESRLQPEAGEHDVEAVGSEDGSEGLEQRTPVCARKDGSI